MAKTKSKNSKGVISDEMEIEGEIQMEKRLRNKALKHEVPAHEKVDIRVDDIYSSYYDAELQMKLKKRFETLNSSMRRVGDHLDINHARLKNRDITYKEIADALNLSESQVYHAVKDLEAYNGYSFSFHPTRKKHTTIHSFGSFRFSIDDYTGWSKENDSREKNINRRIIVVRKSQDSMFPKYKEQIKHRKIQKIKELKRKVQSQREEEERQREAEEEEMVKEIR